MTPAELLTATAADMRAVADGANASPGAVIFWARQHGKVAVQDHIAAWSPEVTQWVAKWLDEEAYRYANPDNAWQVPFHVNQGIELPMLKICEAWWKSRGREPVAP